MITSVDVGGAQRMLAELTAKSNPDLFEHRVVSMTSLGGMADRFLEGSIQLTSLGMRRGAPSPLGCMKLVRLLRRAKSDLLQTWLYHADLLGLIAGRVAGVPRIVWNIRCSAIRFDQHPRLTGIVVRNLARLSSRPTGVVFNSISGLEHHMSLGYEPRRSIMIPNGFDLSRFRPSAEARARFRTNRGFGPHRILIGMMARYGAMKDLDTLLDAFTRLSHDRPLAQLLLIGPGMSDDNSALVAAIRVRGLGDTVTLLGAQRNPESILPALDVFVLSSHGEGFPNVIGEAMACGIRCVSTDVGDASHLIGGTGLTVPRRDVAALAGALELLIESPNDEPEAARDRIRELFAIERIVDQYEALYLAVARDQPWPRATTCGQATPGPPALGEGKGL